MPRGPVSVQLYSVREQIAEDLEGTLERLASLGFTNVEPYGAFVVGSDLYAAALASTGLSAPSAHAGVLGLSDPSPAFEAAARAPVASRAISVRAGSDRSTPVQSTRARATFGNAPPPANAAANAVRRLAARSSRCLARRSPSSCSRSARSP